MCSSNFQESSFLEQAFNTSLTFFLHLNGSQIGCQIAVSQESESWMLGAWTHEVSIVNIKGIIIQYQEAATNGRYHKHIMIITTTSSYNNQCLIYSQYYSCNNNIRYDAEVAQNLEHACDNWPQCRRNDNLYCIAVTKYQYYHNPIRGSKLKYRGVSLEGIEKINTNSQLQSVGQQIRTFIQLS